MNNGRSRILTLSLAALTAALLVLGGCSSAQEDAAAKPKKVELAYVEWSSEVASTNVVKAVLQERLGYEVEITPVSASAMWQAVASGDVDGMVAAWLPTTHNHYLAEVADKVEDLGANLVGTRVGLVVPAYVTISTVGELAGAKDRFDSKIIGIDPGAGLMSKTEKVMEDYGLEGFTLVEGSGATMTAALANAISREEWAVVTGWTPHWKFARWDLKYLEDPKNIYGGEEEIHTIVRKGLAEDLPEVYAFLDRFHWGPDDMAELMVWNQEEGADPYETAKRWIAENKAVVDGWL